MDCIITKKIVQNIIGNRNKEIHKGDCGRVLIVAGSKGMAGAAILSARAALRSGAGLVQLAVPEELFPILQVGVPEATCITRDFSKIDFSRYDAVALGPGLGMSEESVDTVKAIFDGYQGPLVLDADGINIVSKYGFCREGRHIVTPHLGEAYRMLGEEAGGRGKILSKPERIALAKELVRRSGGAINVLKGRETIVAIDEATTYINTTGNPGMATAGSGDVLTGVLIGLLGQKKPDGSAISEEEAAICGVYLHGLAGDLAAKELGEYGLIASDLVDYTALAIKQILKTS